MLIIDDFRVAFLHVYKTAGTSIKNHLRDLTKPSRAKEMGAVHGPLESKVRLLGERFNEYTILTSVRNPFSRLLSIYLYRRRRFKDGERTKPTELAHKLPFKKWFTDVILHSRRYNDMSISDSILMDGKLPSNVYIVAMESLDRDMDRFIRGIMEIDTYKKVPHDNKTDLIKGHHDKYYDKEMIDLVYKWDQWVVDNYYPWSI